jgi:UDP-3-O-[3-hydroxymyristoyl] glucosamine N-acyltransferase
LTLGEIAQLVNGRLRGPADVLISGPVSSGSKNEGGIAFAETAEYLAKAEDSGAAALLLPLDIESASKPFIQVENPRAAFMVLLKHAERPLPLAPGIHPTAVVHPSAEVHPSARVGPYAVIEVGARIGEDCRIYPFAYIGEDCELADDCVVFPHAVLYQNVSLGRGTIIHAGAVLGADGFGYVWDGEKRIKVPQIGSVVLGENCEVGALTAIDRGTVDATEIGDGTKLDNLVQVAHNVRIGKHGAVAAQVGLAGSATLGDRVMMAGQSGVGDHVTIVSDVAVAARGAAIQDITEPGEYIGTPARPSAEGKRSMLLFFKLPELFARLRKLERRLGE